MSNPTKVPSGSTILEEQVSKLRREIKQYERAFTAANDGRKPTKHDIDSDAFVAAKYKEYHRLRRPIDKQRPVGTPEKRVKQLRPASQHKRTALRERSGNEVCGTPQKAWKCTTTLVVVPEDEVVEPTPAFIRCGLGPTPQKDGQVLGIFDLALSATPSKVGFNPPEPVVLGTPSKASLAPPPTSSHATLSATPQSSSKRRFLDAFAGTPLKRKRSDDGQTPSTAKRQFTTPSFLRRSFPLATVQEESSQCAAPPFKKRGLVRSLSSIIQGLKKNEEKRMEDEWDVMNELEAEERGEVPAPKPQPPKVLVEDSQAVEMPLGPDQRPEESESDDGADAGALGADGKPRKPWKKKGLKRQTKRVKMRPVVHKPKKAVELDEAEEDEDVVRETQPADEQQKICDDDEAGSAYGDGAVDTTTSPSKSRPQTKKKASKSNENATSPKKKKVNASAHANFRKLKIKNKNSKAKGRGGRFGRR